ncbi:MAG: hypothetical protein A3I54_01035 [Candidatus Levybacteria bacterium RIFCSPLOWO2_02_FULL_41_11]|nr:MAG: hypothetical protein A3E43_02695 [Candidatus Levybacteria bacterium RIFCSPHIGHO2_12_FULL_40_31]OGH49215.1 MAG: hypothetical protein A3I54_01035 [Candidatus Levybacteria bacterium RIFCSPLOWO2_02_FULL_41_11]
MVAQSMSPYLYVLPRVAYAQEVPQDADQTQVTPTPEVTPSAEPTQEITPVPSPQDTGQAKEPSVTPEPTTEVTPVVEPTNEPTVAPEENQENNNSPPADDSSNQSSTPTVTSQPTPTETPAQTEDGDLSIVILDNTAAPSIDLESYEAQGSASLVTDKPDYAPTDTVLITGNEFNPNETYTLVITSEDEPPVHFEASVTADENGSFVYAYQLDGNYRPNYKVEAKDSEGNIIAVVTFTDSVAGANSGSTFAGNIAAPSGDVSWSNASNVSASDNSRATVTIASSGDVSNYLRATGFGFAIPGTATINGVVVSIERSEANTQTATIRDSSLRLVKNNVIVGDNKAATSTNWPTSDAAATYGTTSDLWGTTWTAADINNANFGVVLSVGRTSGGDEQARVDHITITVTYTEAAQPDLVVTKTNNVAGNAVINQPFTWTLTVTNNGNASATFSDEDILEDDLPSSGATYSPTSNLPVITSGGVTGSIDCDISSNTLDCDDNSGGSSVVIPAGGSFSVSITVTPTEIGTLTNPRSGSGNICRVDPDTDESESNENNNDCSDSVTVGYDIVDNPTLPQACGLDIALVIDSSASVDSGELTQMKNAFKAFIDALLPSTPTQFSVTDFDTTASVVQAFSGNATTVKNAIDGTTSGGFTNWQDGLTKGQSTFDPRPAKPNLVILASDGNPNRIGNPALSVSESQAVSDSVTIANTIKSGGTRVLTIGIGSDLDTPNLQAISGPNVNTGNVLTSDVITTDFAGLATQLGDFAEQTCGGTISVIKLVDQDGNLQTTGDQTPASGWEFNIGGTTKTTDTNGQTDAVQFPQPGTYDVEETVQPGYSLLSAFCTGAVNNGSPDGDTISGIEINNTSVVSCTFINTQTGSVKVNKLLDENGDDTYETINPGNFTWSLDGSDTNAMGTTVPGVLAGQHSVDENTVDDYHFIGWFPGGTDSTQFSCSNLPEENNSLPANINVEPGQTTEITLCNQVDKGSISGSKLEDADGNILGIEDQSPIENWTIELYSCVSDGVDCDNLVATTFTNVSGLYNFTNLSLGFYQVREVLQAGWTVLSSLFYNITINPGTESTGNDFVNFENINITVCKLNDADGNPETDGDQVEVEGWTVNLLVDGQIQDTQETNEDGCYTWTDLGPDHTYGVSEDTPPGWTPLTDTSVDFGAPSSGENESFTFINFLNISLSGQKFNDLNGDGVKDQGEPGLAGWTINLGGDGNDSATTNNDGNYEFTNLGPGSYAIAEEQQAGWAQTAPTGGSYSVDALSGQDVSELDFGNQVIEPIIEISKVNDAVGDKGPGGSVLYTITLSVSEGFANNVFLTDLLPEGFTYQSGSWTALLNGLAYAIPEPVYTSPGVWDLGDLIPGDIVTLSYVANISGDQKAGNYKDVAFAKGENIISEQVLASAIDPGFVDTNFAGSEVNVVKGSTESVGLSVNRGGEVLGASTELPATGAKTLWTLSAIALLLAGLNLMVIGFTIRKRYV